jgi:hypothetical protein
MEVIEYMRQKHTSRQLEVEEEGEDEVTGKMVELCREKNGQRLAQNWPDPKATTGNGKQVVTSQVLATGEIRQLMQKALAACPAAAVIAPTARRHRELVVLVPKLANIVKNVHHIEKCLKNSLQAGKLSISVHCVTEEPQKNIFKLRHELKKRQVPHDHCLNEKKDQQKEEDGTEEEEVVVVKEVTACPSADQQRSLRHRLRHNYEESTPEEELLFNTYVKPSGRAPPPPPATPAPVPEAEVSEDEDTYGQHFLPKGRERIRFSEAEVLVLEQHFDLNPYPKRRERRQMSQLLRLPAKNVRIWFQNKRNKTEDGKMKCFFVRNNIGPDGGPPSMSGPVEEKRKEEGVKKREEGEEEEDEQFCQPCGKAFSTRWNYKVHRRKFHQLDSTEKPKCKECGKMFDTKWNLKTHMIQQHGKLTGRTICVSVTGFFTVPCRYASASMTVERSRRSLGNRQPLPPPVPN